MLPRRDALTLAQHNSPSSQFNRTVVRLDMNSFTVRIDPDNIFNQTDDRFLNSFHCRSLTQAYEFGDTYISPTDRHFDGGCFYNEYRLSFVEPPMSIVDPYGDEEPPIDLYGLEDPPVDPYGNEEPPVNPYGPPPDDPYGGW